MNKKYTQRAKFNLELVEEIETPEGMTGDQWYRYVIGEGVSKIEGLRSGPLQNVKKHAQAFCDEINDRMERGGSTYSPRSSQKK